MYKEGNICMYTHRENLRGAESERENVRGEGQPSEGSGGREKACDGKQWSSPAVKVNEGMCLGDS